MTIKFRSDMTVELIDSMGGDHSVIRSARVSSGSTSTDASRDAGLINYLMRDRHGSPFEHANFTFFTRAPIFMWREHFRHRMASYNEESGRYKVLDPVFYVPGPERKLVQIGKTGAYEFVDGTPEQYETVVAQTKEACRQAYAAYNAMLEAGVAREVARIVLPLTIYSSAYVTLNARSLMNFLSLRTTSPDDVLEAVYAGPVQAPGGEA